jgi:hypothetical protein
MSRYRPRRILIPVFLVAGVIWLSVPGAAAPGGRAGRVWGPGFGFGVPEEATVFPRAGLAAQLWHWLAGIWEKAGARLDPNGQPHANGAAGCPTNGETGATIDPHGGCGAG